MTVFKLASPSHIGEDSYARTINVNGSGPLNGQSISGLGGVQFIFIELCYCFRLSRGWLSEEDPSENKLYYLFTKVWFRTISPAQIFNNIYHLLIINTNGCLSNDGKINELGGVLYSIFTI